MTASLRCAAATVFLCSGCYSYTETMHVTSTAGASFSSPAHARPSIGAFDQAYEQALRESAAHDIPCGLASIRVRNVRPPQFIADGCGQRLVYECPVRPTPANDFPDLDSECQMLLVNRLAP
jgi:hypothetical protein